MRRPCELREERIVCPQLRMVACREFRAIVISIQLAPNKKKKVVPPYSENRRTLAGWNGGGSIGNEGAKKIL